MGWGLDPIVVWRGLAGASDLEVEEKRMEKYLLVKEERMEEVRFL